MGQEGSIAYTASANRLKERIVEYQNCAFELKDHMSFTRAWYAVWHGGKWLFGPSKFVGYDALSCVDYLRQVQESNIDGRDTEQHLKTFAIPAAPEQPEYEEVQHALTQFLDHYNKRPNLSVRWSIVKGFGKP